MSIQITNKVSRNGEKTWYTYEWGKAADERKAAGVFTYTHPKDQIQANHNKQAIKLLDVKKSQMTIEQQATGTPFVPQHRFKDNFLDYYSEFVENNKRDGNRHLQGSLDKLKLFIKKTRLLPFEITENFCTRYRTFLLDKLTGKTPSDYFGAYKRVIKCATKEGYFRTNPAEDTKSKKNPCKKEKEFLEADEYITLIQEPIINTEIRDAFIFACYTGLRWCDIVDFCWEDIKGEKMVTKIIQAKTGKPVEITLHPIALTILKNKRKKLVSPIKTKPSQKTPTIPIFKLPTHDGTNKSIRKWIKRAGINKDITFSCARLSFSILLQDALVDQATVALLLGHTTTRYVNETYKRHRPKDHSTTIAKLPFAEWVHN